MNKAAEQQRLFSFIAAGVRGCCVRNHEVWFGMRGAAHVKKICKCQKWSGRFLSSQKWSTRLGQKYSGGQPNGRNGLGEFFKWLEMVWEAAFTWPEMVWQASRSLELLAH